MKRMIILASFGLAFVVPAAAQAHAPTAAHIQQYRRLYHKARSEFGASAVGCNLIEKKGSCHQGISDAVLVKSIGILERMLLPAPAVSNSSQPPATNPNIPTSTMSTYAPGANVPAGGGLSDVPGVPSSFASCVAMRESTDGAGSSNIYGIEGIGGTGSLSQQKAAFQQMYDARGTEPWAQYDGC